MDWFRHMYLYSWHPCTLRKPLS